MTPNEGNLDRGLRITAGVSLIALAATSVLGPWAYLGVVPLLTGAVGYCPVYTVLGVNTCSTRA